MSNSSSRMRRRLAESASKRDWLSSGGVSQVEGAAIWDVLIRVPPHDTDDSLGAAEEAKSKESGGRKR